MPPRSSESRFSPVVRCEVLTLATHQMGAAMCPSSVYMIQPTGSSPNGYSVRPSGVVRMHETSDHEPINEEAILSEVSIAISIELGSGIFVWMLRELREEIIDHGVDAVGWLPPPLLPRKTVVDRAAAVVQPDLDLLVDIEIDFGLRESLLHEIHQFESTRTGSPQDVIHHFDAVSRCVCECDRRQRRILEVEDRDAGLRPDPDRERFPLGGVLDDP